jgi:hypothetical protein
MSFAVMKILPMCRAVGHFGRRRCFVVGGNASRSVLPDQPDRLAYLQRSKASSLAVSLPMPPLGPTMAAPNVTAWNRVA